MSKVLPTGISQAFWCNPADGKYDFEPAQIQTMAPKDAKGICWLDQLLDGGIVLPGDNSTSGKALTILLAGPPGSGKSTLAMELCYRWSEKLQSLYITTEAHKSWMIANAKSFGWKNTAKAFGKSKKGQNKAPVRILSFRDSPKFDSWIQGQGLGFADTIGGFLDIMGIPRDKSDANGKTTETLQLTIEDKNPDVVVLDSLNTSPDDKAELFQKFVKIASSGPKILIVVLDSPNADLAEFWEFASDVVIRLGRVYEHRYMNRTLEVVKARYQKHVWGVHQLKIYEPFEEETDGNESEETRAARLMRSHPYRREGGIFIFPSIPYVLSIYKRLFPRKEAVPVPSPISNLNRMLFGGYPQGRCIGLVGGRGSHKSHLGYVELLSRLVTKKSNEKALVISLRDDEGVTRKTMQSILQQQWKGQGWKLEDFEREGRLEITYYPPGHITPEEFFHRMLLSIHRLKNSGKNSRITMLFNSLDQLSSRFPLCAKEEIFIPGIIQTLLGEEVTSFFVAAKEADKPPEYYGLLSMAELILSLDRKPFKRVDYLKYLGQALGARGSEIDRKKVNLPNEWEAVELSVVRYAGGQAAGSGGILELLSKDDPLYSAYKSEGLFFLPFAKEHVRDDDGKALS